MKLNLLHIHIICAALGCIFAACGNHNDEPLPTCPPPTPVDRTLLVYMVANNDLGDEGWDMADISEMRTAAAAGAITPGHRVLIMHQAPTGRSMLKELHTDGSIDTLLVYDDSESPVTISRMTQIFDDMATLAPARSYGLVLWSHGTGWLENGLSERAPLRSYGYDRGRCMNVTSLARALESASFDFIYFDCCFMAGVEVVYELRHVAKTIVGSATELPKSGMPYDLTLGHLLRGDMEAAAAATFGYYDGLQGSKRTCTISVIDTSALDDLALATRRVYADARELPQGVLPQSFERSSTSHYYDLAHFVTLISPSAEATAQWEQAAARAVTYKAATPAIFNSITISTHCGLSTRIPASEASISSSGYDQLQWTTDVASMLPWH